MTLKQLQALVTRTEEKTPTHDLPVNHFAEFKINASLFTPPKPKEAAEHVFIEDEEKKLRQIALKDFEEHPEHIGAAAVLINLSLGLRVSELVALQ